MNYKTHPLLLQLGTMAVVGLIVFLNCYIAYTYGFAMFEEYGSSYDTVILNQEYWRIFSAMFVHGNLFHLCGNMIALIVFSRALWKRENLLVYIALYFGGGIVGALISAYFHFYIGEGYLLSVGASGAIMAIYGGYMGLQFVYGGRKLRTLFSTIVMVLYMSRTPGTDIACHIGGCLFGLLFITVIENILMNRNPVRGLNRMYRYGAIMDSYDNYPPYSQD